MSEPRHYSYTHYADRDIAAGFDQLRFGGPIGQYLLETQERILLSALSPVRGRAVLDVGTGTGRAAIGLARAGAIVTGVDASREMLDVARARATEAGVTAAFQIGDAHALPFPDRSFDAAVSFRVLMHTPGWQQCIAELCRVSRSRVVIDFPALRSVAAIESGVRAVVKAVGGRTEAYRVLAEGAVQHVLATHGFRIVSVHRQFVLPIAFHKVVNSLGFTRGLERALAAVGLLRAFGSPVTMVAER